MRYFETSAVVFRRPAPPVVRHMFSRINFAHKGIFTPENVYDTCRDSFSPLLLYNRTTDLRIYLHKQSFTCSINALREAIDSSKENSCP